MTDLMELASRVEAGEGPDRDLDAEIKEAVGHMWDYAADWGPRGHDKPVAFAYTASLDAAMTLIPGDEMWDVSRESADTYTADLTCFYRGIVDYEPDADKVPFGRAKSPALALTAACLRARAHQGAAHVDQ